MLKSTLQPSAVADQSNGKIGQRVSSKRVRVDGKFFARGSQRLRLQGVTYGPFAPNDDGDAFPCLAMVREDFRRMRDAGVNALRTYHLPPGWFLYEAAGAGLQVMVDVPWRKHLCFLESAEARREARLAVRDAARRGRAHPSLLAYSIGNEIPADILRWHGPRAVQGFLAELCDVCRQTDPEGLVTYASFPPTEYLDLSFLDFATFNVYLHDREVFCRYLCRLQNLVGDVPLVLGELGMDTLRHGEQHQSDFLAGHVTAARLMGLAGAFVFSWTDDWHTGGHQIDNWAFGITHADRFPKASYHTLREVYESSPAATLAATPRVSVVVCSYNGGRTLEQCLRSLRALDYPDYEVILVDDGSTDDTRTVALRFPEVRAIHQPNRGLSAARNVGLQAATGDVVAYTDSDCFVDADWLTHLVHQLQRSGAAAVGGPNLTPEDGWLAACVAASPGQPSHVLETDQVAEHIPGCNMAFWREALVAINGFDPVYRKAGDDVDVCWRLQQAGRWITFAPGAFVWHHRRQGPRSYLRQQAGYGEAEALLRFKHPDKFNGWGDGKWRGVLYGVSLQGIRLGGSIIYRGTYATGLFQCIYQRGPAHWAMLPSSLEWHVLVAAFAVLGFNWPLAWLAVPVMLLLSFGVAILQAAQARLAPAHEHVASRCVIAALCYLQPLIRSAKRYRTRLFSRHARGLASPEDGPPTRGTPLSFWSEEGRDRTEFLQKGLAALTERHWGTVVDTGWADWDLEIHTHTWTTVRVCTVQEEHGSGKRLIRLRHHLRVSRTAWTVSATGLLALLALCNVDLIAAGFFLGVLLIAGLGAWWRGHRLASQAVGLLAGVAEQMGMTRCPAVATARNDDLVTGAIGD